MSKTYFQQLNRFTIYSFVLALFWLAGGRFLSSVVFFGSSFLLVILGVVSFLRIKKTKERGILFAIITLIIGLSPGIWVLLFLLFPAS